MNPTSIPPDHFGDVAAEARIVAWVHGESSAVESAALERLCQDRPELSAFRRRMEALHESLTQVEPPAAAAATWKLPPAKRRLVEELMSEKSMVRIDTKKVGENRWAYFKTFSAVAACFLVAAVVLQTTRPAWMELTPVVTSGKEPTGEIYGVDSLAMSKNRDSGLREIARQKQLAGKKLTNPSGDTIAAIPAAEPDPAAFASQFASESPGYGALDEFGLGLGSRRMEAAPSHEAQGRLLADLPTLRRNSAAPAAILPTVKSAGKSSTAGHRHANFPFNSSDVSFQLAKTALAQGKRPDPGAIQLEEFYNAVDYGDPAPAIGEPVAAFIEHSAHPFLPNTHLVRVALRIATNGRRDRAENVTVRVKFNPQRIGKHQLLGFEQEGLSTEGAKLTGSKTGVAIYQVEPLAGGAADIGEVSVNFRATARDEMAERTWPIPFSSQPTAFDRAAPSMQLAGLALLVAEKLRGGSAASSIDFNELAGPISRVKQFYGTRPRAAEMLEIIEMLK
jgi:von Willebrand factor